MADFTPRLFADTLYARLASMTEFATITLDERNGKFIYDCLFEDETRPCVTVKFDAGGSAFVSSEAKPPIYMKVERIELERHNFGGNIPESNLDLICNAVVKFLEPPSYDALMKDCADNKLYGFIDPQNNIRYEIRRMKDGKHITSGLNYALTEVVNLPDGKCIVKYGNLFADTIHWIDEEGTPRYREDDGWSSEREEL